MKVLLNRGSLKSFRRNHEQKLDHQLEYPLVGGARHGTYLQEVLHLFLHTDNGLLLYLPGQYSQMSHCLGLLLLPRKLEALTALGAMGLWALSGSYALIIGRLFMGICTLTGAAVENKRKKIEDQPVQS